MTRLPKRLMAEEYGPKPKIRPFGPDIMDPSAMP